MDEYEHALLSTGTSIEICYAGPPQEPHVDIPLRDLAPIVVEVLRRDLLTPRDTALILDDASEAIVRRERGIQYQTH